MEHRSFHGQVEVREGPNGPMICGYGAVFNKDSADMGFIEQVDPAAFNRTITQADVRGLGNHDPNWLLGRAKSGTLRTRVDTNGLWYEIDVNEQDPDGQRALAKVRRGDWDGSSFGFTTVRDQWNWTTTPPQRRLLEVKLLDVGPVTFPAYPDATATSRALEPIAAKVGRPVGELVDALKNGEIRSLIDPNYQKVPTMEKTITADSEKTSLRALPTTVGGAPGPVAWGPEAGVNDLMCDITTLLNEADPATTTWCCIDVTITMDNALISNWADNTYYVAPFTIGDDGEPILSDQSAWTAVEQGWLVSSDDMERAITVLREQRAGKMISSKNMDVLSGLHDSLQTALKSLRDLIDVAQSGSPEGSDVGDAAVMSPKKDPADEDGRSISLIAAQLELRRRVAEAA